MSQCGTGPGDSGAGDRRTPASMGGHVRALHLQVTGLVAGYVRGLPVVHGVSIDVARREIVTLIGPNGAGKSTLLKAIAGLIVSEEGHVRLDGRDVTALPTHEAVSAGIGFVPQTGNVFTTLTVHENLKVGAHVIPGSLNERLERAYALFSPLAARRGLRARALSGGERQMLAIARALMTDPSLLMLDEPTAGLAPRMVEEVFRQLRGLAEAGIAVLMVEQNARSALRVSDRGYVLVEGRNRFAGSARALLDDPAMAEAFLGGRR
jgi:branched-chain amino acid transport system ATP-binding protein